MTFYYHIADKPAINMRADRLFSTSNIRHKNFCLSARKGEGENGDRERRRNRRTVCSLTTTQIQGPHIRCMGKVAVTEGL